MIAYNVYIMREELRKMEKQELWDANAEDIRCGYRINDNEAECLFCGQRYHLQEIYAQDDRWVLGERKMNLHVKKCTRFIAGNAASVRPGGVGHQRDAVGNDSSFCIRAK